jgi:hypothetical protein
MDSAQNADFLSIFSKFVDLYMIENTRRFLSAQLSTETFSDMPDVLHSTRRVTSASQTMQLYDFLRINRHGIKE